jgi:hypothetical protein
MVAVGYFSCCDCVAAWARLEGVAMDDDVMEFELNAIEAAVLLADAIGDVAELKRLDKRLRRLERHSAYRSSLRCGMEAFRHQ